jgi:hypothetical protein
MAAMVVAGLPVLIAFLLEKGQFIASTGAGAMWE